MNATNEVFCFLTFLDLFVAKLKLFYIRLFGLKAEMLEPNGFSHLIEQA
jgi:hypothetical protein